MQAIIRFHSEDAYDLVTNEGRKVGAMTLSRGSWYVELVKETY